ncbi:MAG: LemA family protein [Campylobacterales bacterium]|nr:LemA family protein [Campylobacterota bacterium]MBD3842863.1 LemA family protein [Campylobacterales bacterium]
MQLFLIIIVICVVFGILMYNSLIGKKNQVDNIFASVDTILKKRFDLIPNLVASVEKYMDHEKEILTKVTQLRAQAMQGGLSDEEKISLDAQLTNALRSINIALEAYPDLKANQNVIHLQQSLNEIEEQISAARRAYNQSVTDLHNAIEMFPTNIIANIMGLKYRTLFTINTNERENININNLFNNK